MDLSYVLSIVIPVGIAAAKELIEMYERRIVSLCYHLSTANKLFHGISWILRRRLDKY